MNSPANPQEMRARGEKSMTILVVDETHHGRALLTRFVERIGHRPVVVGNLTEALRAVADEQPDLVIADVRMVSENGASSIARLRAASPARRLSILLQAGDTDEVALIEALENGVDDYIPKPVRFTVLAAKLCSFVRTLQLTKELEARNFELAAYRATEEEESRIAQHVISRLTKGELLSDPALRHWVRPAGTYFSGDMVLAARTPSGDLHVLLADAAGHGLSAALNALPVTQPFYAMTEKGFPAERIVAEINRKIRDLLPIERFVAASLISVNFREQLISIWNGGSPPVLVVNSSGEVLFTAQSRHLPLGVADERLFSKGLDVFRYDEPCQVVACSDGLVEIAEPDGPMLGTDGLLTLLAGEPFERRMGVLQDAVTTVLGLANAADDISVLMVDCLPVTAAPESAAASAAERQGQPAIGEWQLGLSLSAEELKYIDAVPLLLNLVKSTACGKRYSNQIFVILSELFNNALDHGLLGLNSRIKLEEDGFARYLEMRVQGLQQLEDATIEVKIAVEELDERTMLRIAVRDTGGGFDHTRLAQVMPDLSQPFGRGIATVRRLCHKLEFRGNGNEVIAHYPLDHGADAVAAAGALRTAETRRQVIAGD